MSDLDDALRAMRDTESIYDVESSKSRNVPVPDFVTDVPELFDDPDDPAPIIHLAIQVDRTTGRVRMWANTDDDSVVARMLLGNLEVLRRTDGSAID
jgi:hypothetical protein